MSRLLLALVIIFFGLNTFAQEAPTEGTTTDTTAVDTVAVDTTIVESEVPVDSTTNDQTQTATQPVVQEQQSIPTESTQEATVGDAEQTELQEDETQEEPRIIYYQTVRDEDRDDRDYRDDDYYRHREYKDRQRKEVKTIAGTMSHSGGFGALSFKSTELRDETIVFAGVRGGWIVNRTLGIGFEAYGAIPTAKFDDIIPERVVTLGGYGGMFLELIFFSNQVVHVTFPVSGGAGWLGYYEDWENSSSTYTDELIDDDVFWYIEPGVDLELNVSRNFRLAGGVSKRYTQDLQLIQTRGRDFNNLNYFLTLKIGSF